MKETEIVVYFTNGRMVRVPKSKAKFVHLGQNVDEEYTPDVEGGVATVNWDNVAFCREWLQPEVDE